MSDKNSSLENTPEIPVVVLCASAGGLEAFQTFFDAMPAHSGMAFIVIQHLAIQQESILHDLIQHHTTIAVHPIVDDMPVHSNNVYVLSSGYEALIWNGRLKLVVREQSRGWPKTIDRFLSSLAEDHGQQTAVVILSGVGTDGVEGARSVKNNGGIVLAQTPESATQTGMPVSVIEAGLADMILTTAQMPDVLLRHFDISLSPMLQFEDLSERITDEDANKVLRLLQRQTGRDFSDYKRSTLRRQIARRMGSYQFGNIQEYVNYMTENTSESEQLVRHMLINVTSFFRDGDAFESLKTNALLPALQKLTIDTVFRVWVPGCATGEEAVSLGILIYECLRELNMPEMDVRIFATDVNREILQQPRLGVYPPSIVDEISPARLHDHFIEEDAGYRVRTHISRMIIWSEHNLVEHPPFSSLHLVSCRNVLIYFQQRLQERVIALFQFALKSEGILFLGSSETLPLSNTGFAVIDSKYKIFQRIAGLDNSWLKLDQPFFTQLPEYRGISMPEQNSPRRDQQDRELAIIKDMLAEHYASTCIIVDEFYQVRYTYGDIDRYLRIVPGKEGHRNILEMAREGLDTELTTALHQSFENDEVVMRDGVWVKTNGEERIINLIVRPIKSSKMQGRQKLIILEFPAANPRFSHVADNNLPDEGEGATITRLREELIRAQKALQNVTQVLQAKSEELTSSMEEIRSANEEIQTTNEELRTSKEELESMNEELNTLNNQLTDQNHELTHANNTLYNFLQSAEIGTIFLNLNLEIREYTFAVTDIFALRPGDKGRPLTDIANQLVYEGLIADTESVLNTLINVEKEVFTTDKRWYSLRISPYRTINNSVDGLVLTFSNITTQKEVQVTAERRMDYVRQLFDTIENCLIELDGNLRILSVNKVFYTEFHATEETTIGQPFFEQGNGQWNIPELRRLLTEIIPNQTSVQNYTVTHEFGELGMLMIRLNARQIEELDRLLIVITEVTQVDA